ncbi:MAG: response regulator [Ginsengibacter sp.]
MKKRILITDDDEDMQDIYKTIFERKGYEVEVVGEANKIFENNYTIPDLFLLDRQLSGHDGLNVCKFLRDQPATKDIPVIIVSASPGLSQFAPQAGANDFIEKPFEKKKLLDMVSKWIK